MLGVAMARLAQVCGRVIALAWCVLCAVSCGGGSSGNPPVITSFAASPSWVTIGQSAILKWSVTGATSLSIDSIGTVNGTSTQVTPTADVTYTLTASNQYGSTQAQATLAVFPPPTTWFAPIGATTAIPEVQGASDYFDLFSPTAAWANAASHVTVFKMYSQMLDLDDATLRNTFADLKRRHIALAIEWGPLEPDGGCGAGIEGFDGAAALHNAQRIRDLGGSLQYVAFDELFAGAALHSGGNPCHWTALKTAQNAAQHAAQIQSVFPDVVMGDIEPVPNIGGADTWLGDYEQWLDAWQSVTGKPFVFFHFDMNWSNVAWRPAASALTRALAARNIPVGHIYNGIGATSDAAWITAAEEHATDFEARTGLQPQQAIFQSWEPYPKHLLPETDPTSFTYLIDRYFRARTTLALTAGYTGGEGRLTSAAGALRGMPIALSAVPLSGIGQLSAYAATGSVPAGTQYLVFGVRVALEDCAADGLPAEFY
jgi:hypothetical protein